MTTDNYRINRIILDPRPFIGVIKDAKANNSKDRFGPIIYNDKKIALARGIGL